MRPTAAICATIGGAFAAGAAAGLLAHQAGRAVPIWAALLVALVALALALAGLRAFKNRARRR
jgi:hypothetical protein